MEKQGTGKCAIAATDEIENIGENVGFCPDCDHPQPREEMALWWSNYCPLPAVESMALMM